MSELSLLKAERDDLLENITEKIKQMYGDDNKLTDILSEYQIKTTWILMMCANNPNYIDDPELLLKFRDIHNKISYLEKYEFASFLFNYSSILAEYDINEINNSILKYNEALCNWIDKLLYIICNFEKEKYEAIERIAKIKDNFSVVYTNDAQKNYIEKSYNFLNDVFSFDKKIEELKEAFIQKKEKSIEIKNQIDSSVLSDDFFEDVIVFEKKSRPSFLLVAEIMVNKVRNIIEKVESFEKNSSFIESCIGTINSWSRRYCDFVSVIPDDNCLKKVIEKPYDLLIPLIEREYSRGIVSIQEDEITISEKIIAELEVYRMNIEECYVGETSNSNALELLKILNNHFSSFLMSIEDIVFDCKNFDDRFFIIDIVMELFKPYTDIIREFESDSDVISSVYNFSGCLVNEKRYMMEIDNSVHKLENVISSISEQTTQNPRKIYHVGDIIEYGKYNDKPVKWKILKVFDDSVMALGLSLCRMKFNKQGFYLQGNKYIYPNEWENSDLRRWLNNDFFNNSFNRTEKEKIKIENEDKVTLLTKEEAETFMTTEERSFGTWWWLRTKPSDFYYIDMVNGDGTISTLLYSMECDVRPVIKILFK